MSYLINDVNYVEQELDGNTILVPVKEVKQKKKKKVALTQKQINVLFDVMYWLEVGKPRWFSYAYDQQAEFSDRVVEVARELREELKDLANMESEWNRVSVDFEKNYVLIEEKRVKP